MNQYQEKHKKLIEAAGGQVEDIFVLSTGVCITKKSELINSTLLYEMNVNPKDGAKAHAEFNSRLTYLAFKDKVEDNSSYISKMIDEFQHRSIFNDEYVTFLIAGCSVETELEFIAHNEATVARLTSSKTNAQNEPLFKLLGTDDEMAYQKELIYKMLVDKEAYKGKISNEIFNMLNFGTKAVSFTITMSIKDWHKTLIGRLSNHGVESEMLDICESIAHELKKEYSYFFYNTDEYYAMNNGKKYE